MNTPTFRHANWCTDHITAADGSPEEHLGPRQDHNFEAAVVTVNPHAFTLGLDLFQPSIALHAEHTELEWDFSVHLTAQEAIDLARMVTHAQTTIDSSAADDEGALHHPAWCDGHVRDDASGDECTGIAHTACYLRTWVDVYPVRSAHGRATVRVVLRHRELVDDFRLELAPGTEVEALYSSLNAAARLLDPQRCRA